MTLNRIVVVLLAVIALMLTAPDIILPWHPFSSFGFSGTPDGKIAGINAGSPAARAGIRLGDRIDISKLGPRERRMVSFLSPAPPGATIRLPITTANGAREVSLSAEPRPRSAADNISDVILILEQCSFIIIAAVLAYLRPSWLTWSFFLYAVGVSANSVLVMALIDGRFYELYAAFLNTLVIVGYFAVALFAMLFPRPEPSAAIRRILPYFGFLAALWILCNLWFGYLAAFNVAIRGSAASVSLLFTVNETLVAAMYVIAIAAFFTNYIRSDEVARKRMQWVALGYVCGFGGIAWLQTAQVALLSGTGDWPIWLINVLQCLNIFVPVTVAYAITKHRVIDVRFFVSRALVYGAITSLAVGILALLDWIIARQLEETRLGLVVEIAGALAIGIGIHRMHALIDNLVDRFVFRSVHEAEEHLERIGDAMMFARTARAIDDMLATETARALRLERATVVRTFDPDDVLALRLHSGRIALDHGDALAVPLLIRHQLFGYVLYGHHENGAAIDPNEREILLRLTAKAAVAYDHVISEERAAENERLSIENRVLRSLIEPAK